jgi:hypothetical protein
MSTPSWLSHRAMGVLPFLNETLKTSKYSCYFPNKTKVKASSPSSRERLPHDSQIINKSLRALAPRLYFLSCYTFNKINYQLPLILICLYSSGTSKQTQGGSFISYKISRRVAEMHSRLRLLGTKCHRSGKQFFTPDIIQGKVKRMRINTCGGG